MPLPLPSQTAPIELLRLSAGSPRGAPAWRRPIDADEHTDADADDDDDGDDDDEGGGGGGGGGGSGGGGGDDGEPDDGWDDDVDGNAAHEC